MSAARDFFAYRRELAGVPDSLTTVCGLPLPSPAALEAAGLGVPVVCGLLECRTCREFAAGRVIEVDLFAGSSSPA